MVADLYGEEREPWNAALRDADQAIRMRRWSDEAVRSVLGRFWAREGRPPVPTDLLAPAWDGPCGATLRRRYGGLAAAWSELGPVPAESSRSDWDGAVAGARSRAPAPAQRPRSNRTRTTPLT